MRYIKLHFIYLLICISTTYIERSKADIKEVY